MSCFTKIFDWFANKTALEENGLNSSGAKNMPKLIKYKAQIISHVNIILTHSVKVGLNHISMACCY